jgi:hypothetical protein
MKRWHLLTCLMALCLMMLGQIGTAQYQAPNRGSPPYEPAVPPPTTFNAYGAYPGYAGGTTAAGSAMNGMANAISAKGNYNLSTSAAAVNMTQAQKNEIQNRQLYENTYFQMQQTNQAYQKAQAGPRPTEEQLARLAREGAPRPVSPGEVNPVNGKINWPDVLQQDSFAQQRAALDQLSAKKAAYGSLSISDQMAARKTIETMFAELKSQIGDLPPQQYLASRTFLRSMIYATAHSGLE